MKWHKISDGDYPEVDRCVLVAMSNDSTYRENDLCVSKFKKDGDVLSWILNGLEVNVCKYDRWAYIDLPTD